ncbi:MAG: SHOCT domain-containing protein [Ferruginibacter sp.]
MKKIFLPFLLIPVFASAQTINPGFENDTLYTSSGYKIFKGLVLNIATGTSAAGYFNYIKFHSNMARNNTYTLANSTLLVNKLKSFKYSSPENNSIRIQGTVTYPDNSKTEEVDILLNFEKATRPNAGVAAELLIPEEYQKTYVEIPKAETKEQPVSPDIKKQKLPDDLRKILVADEIKKLFELYKAGALTKAEYESQKKKLLDRQ